MRACRNEDHKIDIITDGYCRTCGEGETEMIDRLYREAGVTPIR